MRTGRAFAIGDSIQQPAQQRHGVHMHRCGRPMNCVDFFHDCIAPHWLHCSNVQNQRSRT
jgi:hypothetical protein